MNRIVFRRLWISVWLLMYLSAVYSAQKAELVVQTGHSGGIESVAFSPDGQTLASASADRTVKLWEVASGKELRTLQGHAENVKSVAFSPDGQMLASGSEDKTIKLWDVASGKELRTLQDANWVESVAFSSDGQMLASGSVDRTIKLWDIASGKELHTLQGHTNRVNSIAFSPDGQTVASGSNDNTVKLWEVVRGRELRTLQGHGSGVHSVAFSPDGQTVASGSNDNTVKLWEVVRGRELRTLQGHGSGVYSVAFSPDGQMLASGSLDNTVRLWEVASGKELRTLQAVEAGLRVALSENVASDKELRRLQTHGSGVHSVAFSSDGQTLASGGGEIRLWEMASGRELRTLRGHAFPVLSVAFSPDGKTMASGGGNRNKLWELASGKEPHTLQGPFDFVRSVAFSPDGKTLAVGSVVTIKLWEVASGRELRRLQGHGSGVHAVAFSSVAFSSDGQTLASGSDDRTVKLWEVASGKELHTLQGHTDRVNSVAFSPDGKTLASGADDGLRLWEVASGRELRTLQFHYRVFIYSVAFSPDGHMLASGSAGRTIKLWDVASGKELQTLEGLAKSVNSVAFSPDGRTLASGSLDNTVRLWEVASGRELRTLQGHANGVVHSVAFSPDGKTLVSGSSDGKIKLWEVATGSELCSLIALDENDWVAVTPDGLFDGSPAAWNKILWRFNENTFDHAPIEAFFNEFYYPGLLEDIFARKRPTLAHHITQKDRRQIRVVLKAAIVHDPARPIASRTTTVQAEVEEAPAGPDISDKSKQLPPSGARDVRLFRNGSLVKLWHGDVFDKRSGCVQVGPKDVTSKAEPRKAICTATVPIVAGPNNFTAYAFNGDNIKSEDATMNITGADSLNRKGIAYILALGVNEYRNTQYNLKYAVADVQDFAEEFRRQQAKVNTYEYVAIVSLNDRDATKANILKSLADLAAKSQPEDAVIIYFAGHGTALGSRFYLIPHDLGYTGSRTQLDRAGLQNILAHSVSDEELERAVEGIDAGQLVLVIDACNSGQALEAEEKRRGPMNSKGLAQLAYEKGMYILTAAQSYQAANEAARLGHGFLTYALVEEGLKTGAADKDPKDGQVLLREWLDFATERVPQIQQDELDEQKKQGRQLDRIKFAEADSGNERSIQRPRGFYRREAETHPFVVAKP